MELERGIRQAPITTHEAKYQVIQVKTFHIIEDFIKNLVSLQHSKFFPLSLSLLSNSSCLCFIEQKVTLKNVASSAWNAIGGHGVEQQMNTVKDIEYFGSFWNFDARQR